MCAGIFIFKFKRSNSVLWHRMKPYYSWSCLRNCMRSIINCQKITSWTNLKVQTVNVTKFLTVFLVNQSTNSLYHQIYVNYNNKSNWNTNPNHFIHVKWVLKCTCVCIWTNQNLIFHNEWFVLIHIKASDEIQHSTAKHSLSLGSLIQKKHYMRKYFCIAFRLLLIHLFCTVLNLTFSPSYFIVAVVAMVVKAFSIFRMEF